MWVPATTEAQKANALFKNTALAKSPRDAHALFEKALGHLRSSLSWVPHRSKKIDLWRTGREQETANILERVGIAGPPIVVYDD